MTLNEMIERRLKGSFAKRSIQLAKEAHLDGAARLVSLRGLTIELIVPSASRTTEYTVVCDRTARVVWCECPFGKTRHLPCCHAGAAYSFLEQLHKATSEYAPPYPAYLE